MDGDSLPYDRGGVLESPRAAAARPPGLGPGSGAGRKLHPT